MSHVVPMIADPPAMESPFAALVREHWDAVYRLARSLTRNVHDTEDLTQETFLRAWNRIDSFQPGTNQRSWLLKIASNAFLDEQRKRSRRRDASLDTEPTSDEPEVGSALEVAEQAARIREAMDGLSDLTRLVFQLRATQGLSFREIAELTGSTEQSARWHMHHARTTILKKMGAEEEPG